MVGYLFPQTSTQSTTPVPRSTVDMCPSMIRLMIMTLIWIPLLPLPRFLEHDLAPHPLLLNRPPVHILTRITITLIITTIMIMITAMTTNTTMNTNTIMKTSTVNMITIMATHIATTVIHMTIMPSLLLTLKSRIIPITSQPMGQPLQRQRRRPALIGSQNIVGAAQRRTRSRVWSPLWVGQGSGVWEAQESVVFP